MKTESLRSPIPPQSRISEKKPLNYSDADSLSTDIEKDYYEESPYRFYIVMAYFLLTFANGMQWVTFSSCFTNFSITYKLPNWKVNMFSLVFMIIYPIVCIPQGYLVDYYSTRLGIIIASGFTLLGAIVKLFVNKNMTVCFIGQFMTGFFQPAILNSPGKIAARWFKNNSRTLVTSILCLADIIGILFGFIFYSFIIDSRVDPTKNPEDYKQEFFTYLFCELLLNCVFCLPTFFISSDAPTYPTGASQVNLKKIPLLYSLKKFFSNKRFIYLLISTCFVVGYYDVFGTICYTVFSLYNVTDIQSSNIYGVSSAFGIVTAVILSIWLDKYKKFKLMMRLLTIGGVILQLIFTFLLELSLRNSSFNPYTISMIMYTLVNMIVIPFYTIGMNYACEITYPLGESLNGGLMMTMSQLSGIGGTFFCEFLIARYPEKKYLTNIVMVIFFVLGCIFAFLLDDTLDRNEVEETGIRKYSY